MTPTIIPANPGFLVALPDGRNFPVIAWSILTLDPLAMLAVTLEGTAEPHLVVPPNAALSAAPPVVPSTLCGPHNLNMVGKTFKLMTSWRFVEDDVDFIFQVPGNQPAPNDPRVERIKRDDFVKLAKDMTTKSYSYVVGLEDAKPTTQPAAATVEDDEADAMI